MHSSTGGEIKKCGEPCKHRACLYGKTEVEARGQGLEAKTITLQTWHALVDVVATRYNDVGIFEACCIYYNLCAASVITPFSMMLWNLYRRLDGTKRCSYEEYLNLPAIYAEACDIIESENTRIQCQQQKEAVVEDMMKRRSRKRRKNRKR